MSIATSTEPYDYSSGGDYPGDRGTIIRTERPGAPGYAYNKTFPAVWLAENGDVEFADHRVPAGDMLAWMEAVTAAIRSA